MITWTNRIKNWKKQIKKIVTNCTIWDIHYKPEYRYISLSGDGMLQFRGTISLDGKTILITAVNGGTCKNPTHYSNKVFIKKPVFAHDIMGFYFDKGYPLQAHMVLTIKQFEDCIIQDVNYKSWKAE